MAYKIAERPNRQKRDSQDKGKIQRLVESFSQFIIL